MQINAVIGHYSLPPVIALTTNPPLTMAIFEHFQRLRPEQGVLKGADIGFRNNLLYVSTPSFTPEFRDAINSLLTGAEKAFETQQQARKQEEATEKAKKQSAIEAAARALGVPIK
jgi:hypothetical protein